MKKKLRMAVCLIVCVLTLLACACGEQGSGVPGGTEPAETTAENVREVFRIGEGTVIVCAADASAAVRNACGMLADQIKISLGLTLPVVSDPSGAAGGAVFVGPVPGTAASEELNGRLYEKGYGFRVVSSDTAVVCGGRDEGVYQAARLLADELAARGWQLPVETELLKNNDPPKTDAYLLNGHALTEFSVLAADSPAARSAAERFAGAIEKKTGKAPAPGDSACVFEVGGGSPYGKYGYRIRVTEADGAFRILLEGGTEEQLNAACDALLTKVSSFSASVLPKETVAIDWGGAPDSGLQKMSVTSTEPVSGVRYYELRYVGADKTPVAARAVTVDPGAARFAVNAQPAGKTSPVLSQARELESQGKNVLAAVNAGFFRMSGGENTPYGIQVKDGKVLQLPSADDKVHSDKWFGVTADGTPVISDTAGYFNTYKGKLECAVGGHVILLKDGKLSLPSAGGADPRTAVGLYGDGGVAIVCVDGRQSVSTGAQYADIVRIFWDLDVGVTDILNLDGGGSTTLVLENGSGDLYIKNSPSDNPPRSVADILAVVSK